MKSAGVCDGRDSDTDRESRVGPRDDLAHAQEPYLQWDRRVPQDAIWAAQGRSDSGHSEAVPSTPGTESHA